MCSHRCETRSGLPLLHCHLCFLGPPRTTSLAGVYAFSLTLGKSLPLGGSGVSASLCPQAVAWKLAPRMHLVNVGLIELNCKVVDLTEVWAGGRVIEKDGTPGTIQVSHLQMCLGRGESARICRSASRPGRPNAPEMFPEQRHKLGPFPHLFFARINHELIPLSTEVKSSPHRVAYF